MQSPAPFAAALASALILSASAALAQAPPLPAPKATDPVKLELMKGFPPAPEKTGGAGVLSSFLGPVIHWSFLDTGRVRARIAASEARTKEALIVYDHTVSRASTGVRTCAS